MHFRNRTSMARKIEFGDDHNSVRNADKLLKLRKKQSVAQPQREARIMFHGFRNIEKRYVSKPLPLSGD